MYNKFSFSGRLTFFQKVRSFDFWLLSSILILGVVSSFSMFSSEGGQFLYYTQSHIIRFSLFFTLMLALSFVRPIFWYSIGYIFFIIVMILLVVASFYGVAASGSQRWINLYFVNLQPSELMKIAIIICFAKYYHRIQINNVNSLKSLTIPIAILILPFMDAMTTKSTTVANAQP